MQIIMSNHNSCIYDTIPTNRNLYPTSHPLLLYFTLINPCSLYSYDVAVQYFRLPMFVCLCICVYCIGNRFTWDRRVLEGCVRVRVNVRCVNYCPRKLPTRLYVVCRWLVHQYFIIHMYYKFDTSDFITNCYSMRWLRSVRRHDISVIIEYLLIYVITRSANDFWNTEE